MVSFACIRGLFVMTLASFFPYFSKMRPDAFDAYVMYAEGKERFVSYIQMAYLAVDAALSGNRVCAVFYGDASTACAPPQLIREICAELGIEVTVLPGESFAGELRFGQFS